MDEIKIESKGVHKLQKTNLNSHKATGTRSIVSMPSFILKAAADPLVSILIIQYQSSLNTGEVPQDWRYANVVPLFKKGERQIAANYRPVSLTSTTCKILEYIIHSIMKHFKTTFLTNSQHRFHKRRSCELQLIIYNS